MSLELDWHTGWEHAFPDHDDADFRRLFAGQDLWELANAVINGCRQDADKHSGDYSYSIAPLGLGNHDDFTGHRNDTLSTKAKSIWFGFFNFVEWGVTPVEGTDDVYGFGKCGVKTPGAACLGPGIILLNTTGGAVKFCVVEYDAAGDYVTTHALNGHEHVAGLSWLMWTIVYDDPDINIYILEPDNT